MYYELYQLYVVMGQKSQWNKLCSWGESGGNQELGSYGDIQDNLVLQENQSEESGNIAQIVSQSLKNMAQDKNEKTTQSVTGLSREKQDIQFQPSQIERMLLLTEYINTHSHW